jgi:hypothetical protein
MPACCCGGPTPPSPGPPGSLSGQISFPAGTNPAVVVVYAIDAYATGPVSEGYLLTRITPPASTYTIAVPPGDYWVVARLDSDPLSAAGYLHNALLTQLRVNASQNLTNIDIAGWGSSDAESVILRIDAVGYPLSAASDASPSAVAPSSPTPLPVRQRPQGPTPPLPKEVDLPAYEVGNNTHIRLDLPTDWYEMPSPVQSPNFSATYYFVNEDVRSPLLLDAKGVFMVFREIGGCSELNPAGASAQASFFITQQGMANFYFRDAVAPTGGQPFQGSEYFGTKDLGSACFFFKFSGGSGLARDSNLRLFDQIIFQARYV